MVQGLGADHNLCVVVVDVQRLDDGADVWDEVGEYRLRLGNGEFLQIADVFRLAAETRLEPLELGEPRPSACYPPRF
jgi:hypothetical protein